MRSSGTATARKPISQRRRATIYTRNDWTGRFGPIAKAIELLPARTVVLDGEAVAIDRKGAADFYELRRQLGRVHSSIIYKAFDLLWLDEEDMRPLAWSERGASQSLGFDNSETRERGLCLRQRHRARVERARDTSGI